MEKADVEKQSSFLLLHGYLSIFNSVFSENDKKRLYNMYICKPIFTFRIVEGRIMNYLNKRYNEGF